MELIGDFKKAVLQMFSARFIWVVVKSIFLTILLLIAVAVSLSLMLSWILPDSFSLPFIGEVGFLDEVLSFAAVPAILALSPFLMFPTAALFLGLFLDEIAAAVERRHYPHLPSARTVPTSEALVDALKFAGVFLVVNAFALVIYLIAPPLAPFVFWAVNGLLLGREYFTQVALRRLPATQMQQLRRKYSGRVWVAGMLMAIPLSMPILNLIIPLLGVATFTHQFHRLSKR